MKKLVVLFLFCLNANASPIYFYSGIGVSGTQGSLGNNAGEIGFGAELFNNGSVAVDIELGYRQTGDTTGKPIVLAENTIAPDPFVPAPPKPIVIDIPDVEGPKLEPPIVVINVPLPALPTPKPAPVPEPPPTPEPPPAPDPPVVAPCFEEVCPGDFARSASITPNGAKSDSQTVTTTTPTIQNDFFTLSINPKIKVNEFIWLNLKFGAEKKMTDGKIKKKVIDDQSINFNTERFSDDKTAGFIGVGTVIDFNEQLQGYVAADYHYLPSEVNNIDVDMDDIFVMGGLRFKL